MKNILKNIALGAIVLTASAACADMLDTAPSQPDFERKYVDHTGTCAERNERNL